MTKFFDDDRVYSVWDVATRLGVSDQTIYNYIKLGILPALRLRDGKGAIKIWGKDANEFVANNYRVVKYR